MKPPLSGWYASAERPPYTLFPSTVRYRSSHWKFFSLIASRSLATWPAPDFAVNSAVRADPNRLEQILEGLSRVDEPVVFAVHPRTRKTLDDAGLEAPANVRLLRPLGYLDFTALASQARVIATDSGGLQKEAYWHGVPCVTLRDTTEWTETVRADANILVGDDPDAIAEAVTSARMPEERPQLYGDGHASERIAEVLVRLSP